MKLPCALALLSLGSGVLALPAATTAAPSASGCDSDNGRNSTATAPDKTHTFPTSTPSIAPVPTPLDDSKYCIPLNRPGAAYAGRPGMLYGSYKIEESSGNVKLDIYVDLVRNTTTTKGRGNSKATSAGETSQDRPDIDNATASGSSGGSSHTSLSHSFTRLCIPLDMMRESLRPGFADSAFELIRAGGGAKLDIRVEIKKGGNNHTTTTTTASTTRNTTATASPKPTASTAFLAKRNNALAAAAAGLEFGDILVSEQDRVVEEEEEQGGYEAGAQNDDIDGDDDEEEDEE